MSTKLVILGLLQDRDLHGYEIKSIVEEHMGDWTSIAFGSIYFALGKLSDQGFVREIEVARSGNRPSRTIYGITDAGRGEFQKLLEQLWRSPERTYFAFDIALFFLSDLASGRAAQLLEERIHTTESALKHLEEHMREHLADERVPETAKAIFEHSLTHLRAEAGWLTELREMIG